MPHVSQFNHAFAQWLRTDLDRAHRCWGAPDYRDDTVTLRLTRFAPHLVAHLSRHGVNVAVELEAECWDLLWCEDLVARDDLDGWRCSSCPENSPAYSSLEALWVAHLFDPLAAWIEHALEPAGALHINIIDGASWAALTDRAAAPGEHTRYIVFAPVAPA